MNLVHNFLGISLGEKALLLSKDWEEWRVCFVLLGMQEEVSHHLLQPRYAQEHPFMTALCSFSDGCFQEDNTISYQLRYDDEFTVLRWPKQPTDPNRAALGRDGTFALYCTSSIMSISKKCPGKCFQHLNLCSVNQAV